MSSYLVSQSEVKSIRDRTRYMGTLKKRILEYSNDRKEIASVHDLYTQSMQIYDALCQLADTKFNWQRRNFFNALQDMARKNENAIILAAVRGEPIIDYQIFSDDLFLSFCFHLQSDQ